MGNLVPIYTQVKTKDGEVSVTVNLNLNLKVEEGKLLVEAETGSTPKVSSDVPLPDMKNIKFEKPDLEDNSEIINFGKQV